MLSVITRRAYSVTGVSSSISREPGTFDARESSASGASRCSSLAPAHPARYRRDAGAAVIHATGSSGLAAHNEAVLECSTTVRPAASIGKY